MGAGRFNGFDVLRICAALVVVASHAFYLGTGTAEPVMLRWGNVGMNPGFVAVAVFFVTSGYLVGASWDSDPHPGRFAARRAARIWPGLLAALFLTTFVVGPVVTSWARVDYLTSPLTWFYPLSGAILDTHYLLPGVSRVNPDRAVNGSLWSLPLEVGCYVALVGLGTFGVLRSKAATVGVAVTTLAWAWLVSLDVVPAPTDFDGMAFRFLPSLAACFALGVLAHTVRVPRSGWAALVALVALVFVRQSPLEPVGLLAVAYLTVWCGTSATRSGAWLHRLGDPSYGIYVWGWVVSQLLVLVGMRGQWSLALASVAIATGVGYGSWWAIERRAITGIRTRLSRVSPAQPCDVPEHSGAGEGRILPRRSES